MITAVQKSCCISVSLKLLSREKLDSVYMGKWKKNLGKCRSFLESVNFVQKNVANMAALMSSKILFFKCILKVLHVVTDQGVLT